MRSLRAGQVAGHSCHCHTAKALECRAGAQSLVEAGQPFVEAGRRMTAKVANAAAMAMRRLIFGAAVLGLLMLTAGPQRLHLALEDRGDPRPRQVAISAEVAGLCLALIVSWTQRTGHRPAS